MDPATLLARNGLPTTGLHAVPDGTTADIWQTDLHVLRIGAAIDHQRETRTARGALAAGVHTTRPVTHGTGYSIWERLPGAPANQVRSVPTTTWGALLADLERLHANPPESPPANAPTTWRGTPALIDRTRHWAHWTETERRVLHRALGTTRPLHHPDFVHGDAWARNVLVDQDGGYIGIIDWGCARWSALEEEAARLEDPALDLALERWKRRLDLPLLFALRLDLLLAVALQGRGSPDYARHTLSAFEELP